MGILKQATMYLVAGALTFATDFSLYRGLLVLAIPVTVSKVVSCVCAMAVSFNLNRSYVFTYTGTDCRLHRFLVLAFANLMVNALVNRASLWALGPGKINLCFIIATSVTVSCSFLGQKLWVFRSHGQVDVE